MKKNSKYIVLTAAIALCAGSSPVSYTHLDVYKRQGLVRRDTVETEAAGFLAMPEEVFEEVVQQDVYKRQHENRVIVPVKGDYGIKTLALLALESFEQFRVSVGEQAFDFIIREGAVCFQAEHCLLYTSQRKEW